MTEWLFTVVTAENKCPKCGAEPGADCRTPKGRKTSEPHGERTATATKAQVDRCTGKVVKPDEFLQGIMEKVQRWTGKDSRG